MDLTEVEGLSDLLASDTKSQRKQALKQIQGSMRKTFDQWRGILLRCLAHSEAVIDFGGMRSIQLENSRVFCNDQFYFYR